MSNFSLSNIVKMATVALLAFSLSGCPTTYNMGTAKTLEPGAMEYDTTIVYQAMDVGVLLGGDSSVFGFPFLDFGVRYGITDGLDVGASLKGFGKAGIDFKINLIDNESMAISLDPEISGFPSESTTVDENGVETTEETGLLQIDLPVLVDIKLDEDITLTISAKYSAYILPSHDEPLSNFVGGTVGLDIKVSEDFAIHPFAGVTYWIDAPGNVDVIMPHGGLGTRAIF